MPNPILMRKLHFAWNATAIARAAAGGGGGDGFPASLQAPNADLLLRLESTDFDASSDTDPVSTWSDKSGNGNDMTSQGAGYDPWVDQVNTLNGHATVKFINSTVPRHLRRTTAWTGEPVGTWDAAEILVVMYKIADPPSNPGAPFKFAGGSTIDSHVPFSDGNVYENFSDLTRPSSGNPTTSFQQWLGYWIRATRNVAACDRVIYVGSELLENKTGTGTWSDPSPGNAAALGITYQGNYTPPTYPHITMDGNIAAVYLWSQNLSAAQRSDLSGWVNTTYGITIPTS